MVQDIIQFHKTLIGNCKTNRDIMWHDYAGHDYAGHDYARTGGNL